jgi:LuxR family transcriptional regulator, maltose regulon positive regulatory protein
MESNLSSIAKISRPKLSNIFARKRLFKELDSGKKKPITWIVGPAGSGKTTLVASYLDNRKLPCLWYQIDECDTDLATFFYYLGIAAKKAAPRHKKALPYLTPEYMPGIAIFSMRFFEELFTRLKPPFTIVFDNYHEVPDGSPLHGILQNALSRVPEGIRIFVLSRSGPPSEFMRQRANDGVQVVGWNELRFTLEESRQIARLKNKKKLSEDDLSLLYAKTNGWAAGMVLLIESSKQKNINYQLLESLTPDNIFEYFASEIFKKADADVRSFLLKTAFLPLMTVEMAEALTGVSSARRILSSLNENNYFIEKRQEPHPAYHYHPLFRQFLLAHAKQILSSDDISAIQRHAASLLAEAGHIECAAAILIESNDRERLVPLILDYAPMLINQGRSRTLQQWLAAVPQTLKGNSAGLLYWEGLCAMPRNPVESRRFLEQAFQLFVAEGNKTGAFSAWSGVVDAFLMEYDDFKPLDKWIEWLDSRINEGWTFPTAQIETRVASSMAGALTWRMPDHPHIRQWVDRAFTLSKKCRSNGQCLQAYQHVSYFILMGRYDECAVFVNEMKRKARTQDISPIETISLKMVEASIFQMTVESAKKGISLIMDCMKLVNETGLHILYPAITSHGVYIFLSAGDPAMAGKFLADFEKTTGNDRRLHSAHYYHIAAWYHQVIGDFHQAAVLAKKGLGLTEETGAPFATAYTRLGLALALHEIHEKDDEAVYHLTAAQEMGQRTGSRYLEHLTTLASAHFAFDAGQENAGIEAIRKAMISGRENNYSAMVSFWRPDIMTRICQKALEAGIETDYVRRLIRKLELVPDGSQIETEAWPWPLKINTLGRFAINKDGAPLQFPAKAPRKLLMLLKAIISCGPKGASEDQLADMVWPEAGGDSARQSLDTGLHRLRQMLDNDRAIQLREGRITIDTAVCWVDAYAFDELMKQADLMLASSQREGNGLQDAYRMIERAVMLYQGAFLDDVHEPWVFSFRERLRNKYLKAIQKLGQRYEHEGHFDHAVVWYEKGLEVDDVAEPFYQGMMKCCIALGRKSEAIAAYHRCKRTLHAVLNVAPSPETKSLYTDLQAS